MSLDLAVVMCGHYDDPNGDSPSHVIHMYVSLVVVASLCVIAFIATTVIHVPDEDEENSKYETRMKYLGLVYIIIVAYRAFFPTQLIGWFVWWQFPVLSNVGVSRMLSMVAELSFAAMIAYATLTIEKQRAKANVIAFSAAAESWPTMVKSWTCVFFTCAVLAQFFTWWGLVYQNNYWFLVSNACWLTGLLVMLPTFVHTFLVAAKMRGDARETLLDKNRRWYDAEIFGLAFSVLTVLLIAEMLIYDLPKFWWRYKVQVKQDNLLLNSFGLGIREAFVYQGFQRWDVIFSHNMFSCMMIYYAALMMFAVLLSQGPQLQKRSSGASGFLE